MWRYVHGILQARILEWVAMPSFRDLPDPRIEPTSLTAPLASGFFTTSATWEALCFLVMFMFVYLFSWYLEEVTFFHQLCSLILSGVSYKLALTKSIASDWTAKAFVICFYVEPCCYSCWPSTTPEGVQGEVRHSVLQGIWWDRSLDSWMFLGTDFIISILASSHMEKNTKSLHGDIRSSWVTKKPFEKWLLNGIELTLHQNLIDWPSPTATLEQSLRAIWGAASWAAVLILPQIKLNSQLSSCASFLVNTGNLTANRVDQNHLIFSLSPCELVLLSSRPLTTELTNDVSTLQE